MVSHFESNTEDESTMSVPYETYLAQKNHTNARHEPDGLVPRCEPSSSLLSSALSMLFAPSTAASSVHRQAPVKGILRKAATGTDDQGGAVMRSWPAISEDDALWIMVVLPVVALCGDQLVSFLSPWSRALLVTATTAFCVGSWGWSMYSLYATDGEDCRNDNARRRSPFSFFKDIYSPQAKERVRRVRFDAGTKLHLIPRKEKDYFEKGGPTTHDRWSNSSSGGGSAAPPRLYGAKGGVEWDSASSLVRLQAAVAESPSNVKQNDGAHILTATANGGEERHCGTAADHGNNDVGSTGPVRRRHNLPPALYEDSTMPVSLSKPRGMASASERFQLPASVAEYVTDDAIVAEYVTDDENKDVLSISQEDLVLDVPLGFHKSTSTDTAESAEPAPMTKRREVDSASELLVLPGSVAEWDIDLENKGVSEPSQENLIVDASLGFLKISDAYAATKSAEPVAMMKLSEVDSAPKLFQLPATIAESYMDESQEDYIVSVPLGIQESADAYATRLDPVSYGCDPMEEFQHLGSIRAQNADVTMHPERPPSLTFEGSNTHVPSSDSCSSLSSLYECPSDEWIGYSVPSESSVPESTQSENHHPDDPERFPINHTSDETLDTNIEEMTIDASWDIVKQSTFKPPCPIRQSSTLPLRAANHN